MEDLKAHFSKEVMRNASKQYQKVTKVNDKGKWKPIPESIDSHQTPEWFKDAKFGMFIDWGLWSVEAENYLLSNAKKLKYTISELECIECK